MKMREVPGRQEALGRAKQMLGHPSMPLVAAVLAVALCATSVEGGLQTEDYVQRDAVAGMVHPLQCLDLFAFLSGASLQTHVARSIGVIPWYAPDHLALSFWRPLSSITHCIDYRLFPSWPRLMHAESLLFFALAVAAVAALYRRLLHVPWVAGLAALLFAFDDAHGPAVGWLANRNAMLTTLFSALALAAHDRARRNALCSASLLSALWFALALLAGEGTVCVLGYFVAYCLVLDEGPVRARALSLMPHAALFLAWWAVYRMLGHGSAGSSLYVDPYDDLGAFVAAAAERVPVLLASQLGGPSADLQTIPSARVSAIVLGSFGALVLLGLVLLPLLRSSRTARFFGAGTLLSAVPAAAAPPDDRLLFVVGIGAMAVVAEQLAFVASGTSRAALSPVWRRLNAGLAAAFAVVHGLVAPIRLPGRSNEVRDYGEQLAAASATMFAGTKAFDGVAVLRGPEMFGCSFAIALGYRLGVAANRVSWCLSAGPSATTIRRLDDHTISVAPAGGFLDPPLNRLHWDGRTPLGRGDVVRLEWLTIRIDDVSDEGEPRAVSFRFARALDDPSLRWVEWRDGRYEPIALPPIGEAMTLPERE